MESGDSELTISTSNGAELIGRVAVALNEAGVGVKEVTLRTPTLDDVFLHVTGGRMNSNESDNEALPILGQTSSYQNIAVKANRQTEAYW